MIGRRKFVVSVGAGALAPLAAVAQRPPRVWRVGVLSWQSRPTPSNPDAYFDAFMQGMGELGYVEGRNLAVELRSADGKFERVHGYAAEMVHMKVDVIVAGPGTPFIAKQATTTIPIVFANIADPVRLGLVASLARPGGNVTGISNALEDTCSKNLEFLREVVPTVSDFAVLLNPGSALAPLFLEYTRSAARRIGVSIMPFEATTGAQIDSAFAAMLRAHAGALIVQPDPFLAVQARRIVELAARHRLAALYTSSDFVDAGGLMSYGPSATQAWRQAARQVDKILKGTKPGEIPVEQTNTFEAVVNMKAARALAVRIPQSILLQATRVIE